MTLTHQHLGRAIMLCLARARLTGMAAAALVGVSQSGLVRLISGARRADPETLRALSRADLWRQYPHAGQQIMIGHLMDELERAGWQARDILMRARGSRQYALRSLHEIEEHIIAGDEAVAELVTHVADILRRVGLAETAATAAVHGGEPAPMVAREADQFAKSQKKTAKLSQKRKRDNAENSANAPET